MALSCSISRLGDAQRNAFDIPIPNVLWSTVFRILKICKKLKTRFLRWEWASTCTITLSNPTIVSFNATTYVVALSVLKTKINLKKRSSLLQRSRYCMYVVVNSEVVGNEILLWILYLQVSLHPWFTIQLTILKWMPVGFGKHNTVTQEL
jgi:hypothetical protein